MRERRRENETEYCLTRPVEDLFVYDPLSYCKKIILQNLFRLSSSSAKNRTNEYLYF